MLVPLIQNRLPVLPKDKTIVTEEIRALSVRQPWAWCICAGVKTTENRTWSTEHRGTIAIHASTSVEVVNRIRKETGSQAMHRNNFAFGAIIGFADIVDVATYGRQHENDPFAEGPYCWKLANGHFLKKPVPLPGKLNLFTLSQEIQSQLRSAEVVQVDLLDSKQAAIANAITMSPDPVASYTELVEEHWRTGNHLLAMENAGNRLIELAPDSAVGYMIQADIRLKNPDAKDCASLAKRATELAPDDSVAWFLLTSAYLKEQRCDEAIKAADRLICLDPDNVFGYEERARAFYQVKQYTQAIADLDRALQLAPESSVILGVRAETKHASGDIEGAKADIIAALALDSKNNTLLELHREILGGR
jgi:cytochrome c-type biogenesis protein CcmH/NrfG